MISKGAIARRYRYLWTGEAAAIGGFLALFLISIPPTGPWHTWIARTYALAIFLGILLQGVFWWRGRLRLLRTGRKHTAEWTLRRFAHLKRANWLLIAAFPLVLGLKAMHSPILDSDSWWGIGIITAALLEQVNYYHVQLTYGYGLDLWYLRRHRQLRRGNIALYLDEL